MLEQTIAYFPGCSLHGMGMSNPFNNSTLKVCGKLGINLTEVPDWNCCGATSGHGVDHKLALALNARNIGLAARTGASVLAAPCAACYANLIKANEELATPAIRLEYEKMTGVPLQDIKVMHILDLLSRPEGLSAIKRKTVKQFHKLNAVCYYGCLSVRPGRKTGSGDTENPQSMDTILQTIGITALDWSHKTECCGASFSACGPELAEARSAEIITQARRVKAAIIAVACPLCHTNLEMHLSKRQQADLPIVFFSQLIALALGLSVKEAGLSQLLSDPFPWPEKLKSV